MISQQIMWMDLIIHIFDLAKAFSTRCPPWRNPPHLSWLGRGNHEGTGLCILSCWRANRGLVSSLKMLSNLQVIYRIFTDICVWKRFGKSILCLFRLQNVLQMPSAFSFLFFNSGKQLLSHNRGDASTLKDNGVSFCSSDEQWVVFVFKNYPWKNICRRHYFSLDKALQCAQYNLCARHTEEQARINYGNQAGAEHALDQCTAGRKWSLTLISPPGEEFMSSAIAAASFILIAPARLNMLIVVDCAQTIESNL